MKPSRGATGVPIERARRNGKAADQPIYQRVADELTAGIASGANPVGSFLPTEMELCEEYGVSRSTVREALRQLRDAGLISRRRRIGTEVVARTPPVSYRQPINSIADLLQYAEETLVVILSNTRIRADARLASALECRKGRAWLRIKSLRIVANSPKPICTTTAYVDAALPHIREHLESMTGPISAMLEHTYGIRIARVEQTIQAVRIGPREAKVLDAEEGSPALQSIRRYYRDDGTLLELSTTTHPADRFTYVTSLVRQ